VELALKKIQYYFCFILLGLVKVNFGNLIKLIEEISVSLVLNVYLLMILMILI
jgi:hypothetical protein